MTDHQPGVTYTLSAFKRAGFVGGNEHLLLQADQDPEVALRAMGEATYAVTELLMDYEVRDEAYVVLDGPVPTPNGPMARVQDCEPAKALPLMLEHLAAELAARGITGRLVPAKTVRDNSPVARDIWPVLGMILSPLNETDAMYAAYKDWQRQQLLRGCWVEDERHRRVIMTLMDWLTQIQGTVLLHSTGSIEIDPAGLVEYISRALHSNPNFGISATSKDANSRREVQFADSQIIVYDFDPDHPRGDQLAALTDLAIQLAPDLAYALIRELRTSVMDLNQLSHEPPKIELFETVTFTGMLKHLEAHYVYDAGVAQVLTASQLDKATLPPSRWKVDDLGADRYLVTALDPAPWLHPDPYYVQEGNTLPPDWTDPEFLAAARTDFGPAILTLDTLRQQLPPLTSDEIRTDPSLRNFGVVPPEG